MPSVTVAGQLGSLPGSCLGQPVPARLTANDSSGPTQHRRGYIDDETLHRELTTVRRQLGALPSSDDKFVLLDRVRAEVRSFTETVDAAARETPGARRARRDDRAAVGDLDNARETVSLPRRPKPASARCWAWRPRTDSGTRHRQQSMTLLGTRRRVTKRPYAANPAVAAMAQFSSLSSKSGQAAMSTP